ncbi:MAG: 2-C-methyl-D-erythritol 2,4-cyclodiphosphate synthase [Acidimicrobiales bacterium]
MEPGSIRVGQGFDVHRWSDDPDDRLVLGGVPIPGFPGLVGHSDADAVAHACTDAVLGAVGLGDIGGLFPDTDASLAGADSIGLLGRAMGEVRRAGWEVANVDCTVVVDEPKIAPVRQAMEHNLSVAVGAPVTVKGKRTEGVSALGEGVQCFAVALLYRPESAENRGAPETEEIEGTRYPRATADRGDIARSARSTGEES